MDILLLDTLVPEAIAWLAERHVVRFRPELANNAMAFCLAAAPAKAIVVSRQQIITRQMLIGLPQLRVIGRLQPRTENNTDLAACQDRGIKLVQVNGSNVRSTAEYVLSSLLLLYRRSLVPVIKSQDSVLRNPDSTSSMGRELMGSTVGLVGLSPASQLLAGMLSALGVKLLGYDSAVHHSSEVWRSLKIKPVPLEQLLAQSDAVSLQMAYAPRFRHFFGDRLLAHCKLGQLWVSVSRSSLFEPEALAEALGDGRIESCLIDGVDGDFLTPSSPLQGLDNLLVTPELGSHTREARLRASWHMAHRLHEGLEENNGIPAMTEFDTAATVPMVLGDL